MIYCAEYERTVAKAPPIEKSCPADMCGWTGHIQGNLALRVCEAERPSARFSAKFCPQEDTRGKEFLTRDCAQKWVPPGACRFCDTRTPRPRAGERVTSCWGR